MRRTERSADCVTEIMTLQVQTGTLSWIFRQTERTLHKQ
jgi:hypothetical protein